MTFYFLRPLKFALFYKNKKNYVILFNIKIIKYLIYINIKKYVFHTFMRILT